MTEILAQREEASQAQAPLPQAAVGPAALEVTGVTHFYGKRKALDDVSFTVAPGSFTVLLGLNGAGKSTLFSLVTRLYGRAPARSRFLAMMSCVKAARRAPARRGLSGPHARSRTDRHAKSHLSRRAARDRPVRGQASYRRRAGASGLADRAKKRCAISPAAISAVSRSPVPFCIIRNCCCSTKRLSASTSRRAPTSSRRCAASSRTPARRALDDASDR